MSTLSIATSGLSAAGLRLNVAASNIANALDTGPLPASSGSGTSGSSAGGSSAGSNLPAVYVPLQVNQADQSGGGTVATVSAASPGFVAQSDPGASYANQDGLVAAPNVDLASEFVQLITAKYAFAANAKVVQSYYNTTKSLLDVTV
jgi:flagellar basal-body rod protein FlgC